MTERDRYAVRIAIKEKVGHPDGVCAPLAILDSCPDELSENSLQILTEKIIEFWENRSGLNDEQGWLAVAKIYYPECNYDDIASRSSQDPLIKEICQYAYENKCPTILTIPGQTEAGHAVAIKFKEDKDSLLLEFIYNLENERPIIDITKMKVIRDLDGIGKSFFSQGMELHIFPPQAEMKLD